MSRKQGHKFRSGIQWLAWSATLAGICLASGLGYFLVFNSTAQPVTVQTVAVETGTVENTIDESGTVELQGQRTIKSPTEGAVDRVLVQPGNQVKADQVLVILRYPERQTALANQQLKILEAQATLVRNRQKILEAQEQLIADEKIRKKLDALAQEGAVAQQQVQELEDKVRQNEADIRNAQLEAQNATIQLQIEQLQRQSIQQKLQDTLVRSPLDGTVLGVSVKNGDGVELRTDLLTVGDPAQVKIKLLLSPLNAAQVRVNQVVRVSAIAPNAKTFTGTIQSVYPQAVTPEESQKQSGRSGGSSDRSNQPRVPATVKLDTPTRSLIPGSGVNVEIVLEQRRNVLVLNSEIIQRTEQRPFVWVKDSQNKAQKRYLKLGLEGLLTAEVAAGLNFGEKVILPPAEATLTPGTPVISY
ncbi:efflux RND transporter periplasmic adaptor subunit [Chroococcidiopsis thermalis]|uniref:Efflux transporter, RND family, MFP subunit n=1 Tax=Chroococcidiopsis thermalis (strain PCC 7203) TaxID=251229 RepID=K9TZ52_CHRTP|nr:efflux RND transporter periplasmic adaptor subunit [Chroococcidiopsis thermalis]AFY87845.1 efflux transporter, RND family, MFP subunit [Chroococcidiopsis thermalis PCC 7203]